MSPNSDENTNMLKTAQTAVGEAAKEFVKRLPENIAAIGGAAAGYGSGQGLSWALGDIVANSVIGGVVFNVLSPILIFGGLAVGAVYSYKLARIVLREKEESGKKVGKV